MRLNPPRFAEVESSGSTSGSSYVSERANPTVGVLQRQHHRERFGRLTKTSLTVRAAAAYRPPDGLCRSDRSTETLGDLSQTPSDCPLACTPGKCQPPRRRNLQGLSRSTRRSPWPGCPPHSPAQRHRIPMLLGPQRTTRLESSPRCIWRRGSVPAPPRLPTRALPRTPATTAESRWRSPCRQQRTWQDSGDDGLFSVSK